VREIALRLKLSKTTVSTYLLRAREAGLNCWPLPADRDDDTTLKQALFQRVGRPPRDLTEPDWPRVSAEMKRKGVTLVLLWEEYRAAHPDGYGYTWFCQSYRAFESRLSPRYRNRHEAGATMQTDYAGQTVPIVDPATGAEYRAQIFVAVLGASNYTFAWASLSQKLPDWIEAQARALGADAVLDHTRTTPEDWIGRQTDGAGFDLVFDTVGGQVLFDSISATRIKGRVVTISGRSTLDIKPLFQKGASLHTVFMLLPMLTGSGREAHGAILREIARLVDAGRLRPLLDAQRFGFSQVADAHARLESGQAMGKILLVNDL